MSRGEPPYWRWRGGSSLKGLPRDQHPALIESADIARGTFYLYFESKRAIFDELLDGLVTTLQAQVKRIEVGPGTRPRRADERDGRSRAKTLLDNREMARILLREAVGIDTDFDRKLSDFYGRSRPC